MLMQHVVMGQDGMQFCGQCYDVQLKVNVCAGLVWCEVFVENTLRLRSWRQPT